jgi:hypothetical protein
VAGREPHPEECPALWPGFRAPDQASLNLKLWRTEGRPRVFLSRRGDGNLRGSVELRVEIYWDAQIAEQIATLALSTHIIFSNCS